MPKGYKKQQHLVVFHSPDQAHQRNQEQEDAHGDDHANHSQAGDQSEADAPGSDANQQQADQLQGGEGGSRR